MPASQGSKGENEMVVAKKMKDCLGKQTRAHAWCTILQPYRVGEM